MEYRLTIIMSNYNQAALIEKAFQSILEQKVSFPYKIIITDDCSTLDDSEKIINEYTRKYKNVEALFSDKNSGYLVNILKAKRITKTDYFCLLDADDYWTDNCFLQNAFDFLENNPDYAIYESNVYVMPDGYNEKSNKDNLKTFVSTKYKSGSYTVDMFVNNQEIPITQTTGMFFRNTIFKNGVPSIMEEAVGTQAERSFEGDMDRFVMHLKTGKAYYSNKPVGVYRVTKGGIWSRLSQSEKSLLNARSYMDYYSFYQRNPDFFVNKAWCFLKQSFSEKQTEIEEMKNRDNCIVLSNSFVEKANSVYDFCYQNRSLLNEKEFGISKKTRIKRAIHTLIK